MHKEQLNSFEWALRDAGIAPCNLVSISSILPPGCKIISRTEGLKLIKAGQIAFVVMSRNQTNEAHRLMAASVGVAIPKRKNVHGYLSEHHSFGQTDDEAGAYAEFMAASMLASSLGEPFNLDKPHEKGEKHYELHKEIVDTRNIT